MHSEEMTASPPQSEQKTPYPRPYLKKPWPLKSEDPR